MGQERELSTRQSEKERVRLFATKLRMARAKVQMNQTDLGRRLGVDASTISVWERAMIRRLPPEHVIMDLAQALGVDPDYFTQPIEEPHPDARYYMMETSASVKPKSDEVLWAASTAPEPGVRKVQLLAVPSDLTESDIETLLMFAETLVKRRELHARSDRSPTAADIMWANTQREQENSHERVDP